MLGMPFFGMWLWFPALGIMGGGSFLLGQEAAASLPLVPMPREIRAGAVLPLAHGVAISTPDADAEDRFAAEDLIATLKQRGIGARSGTTGEVKIVLLRDTSQRAAAVLAAKHLALSPEMRNEGYVLATEGNTTYDIASSAAGVYYGAQTLKQLISGPVFQSVEIRDWPAMPYRGISHDISRGPISTLEFQKHIIQALSEYKINIYSPYMENSLEYQSEPLPAQPGGSLTRRDVDELVRYARQFHVTIVPEQEAFGHMHHTLMFEQYLPLGETPHGSALAPGQPGSIELVRRWVTELAAIYPGPFIHVGADEVNELGTGQSQPAVAAGGEPRLYMDFLKQIYGLVQPLHKRMLFWGDIAMREPELVKTLPKDIIAVAWEYGPRPEGFEKWLRPYVDAGMETWVSPGLNNWDRVYPNYYEALLNIQRFVRDGQRLGSTGVLNTVWNSDDGSLFNANWYGLLFGAAAGWQPGESSIARFENSFGQVFHGDLTGKINEAQRELAAAHQCFSKAGSTHGAMAELFWMDPWTRQGQATSAKLLPLGHEIRLHSERAITLIKEAEAVVPLRETDALRAMELGARRMDFIVYKFQAAQQIADQYALADQQHNGGRHAGEPLFHLEYYYQDLVYGYGLLHDLYEQAWGRENRPFALHNILAHYDMNIQLWLRRSGCRVQFARNPAGPTDPAPPGVPADCSEPMPYSQWRSLFLGGSR
ncbi:MAG: family 20 glycosylhydrolase [Bryobacteraceae bacterium]